MLYSLDISQSNYIHKLIGRIKVPTKVHVTRISQSQTNIWQRKDTRGHRCTSNIVNKDHFKQMCHPENTQYYTINFMQTLLEQRKRIISLSFIPYQSKVF